MRRSVFWAPAASGKGVHRMRSVKRFTADEDAYIRENSGRITLTALARNLGRNPASVVSRSATLGLHVPNRTVRKFSPQEDRALREGAGRISLYEIARRLGRKPSSCYGRAKAIGLDFSPARREPNARIKDGYRWVPVTSEGRRIWRQEHRVVMEQDIGRPLTKRERVHHVDLDRTRNKRGNLYLCKSESEHRAIHNRLQNLLATAAVVQRLLALGIIAFDHDGGNYTLCGTSN